MLNFMHLDLAVLTFGLFSEYVVSALAITQHRNPFLQRWMRMNN